MNTRMNTNLFFLRIYSTVLCTNLTPSVHYFHHNRIIEYCTTTNHEVVCIKNLTTLLFYRPFPKAFHHTCITPRSSPSSFSPSVFCGSSGSPASELSPTPRRASGAIRLTRVYVRHSLSSPSSCFRRVCGASAIHAFREYRTGRACLSVCTVCL